MDQTNEELETIGSPPAETREPAAHADPGELEGLLEYLKRSRGLDLTGYKRPSLRRRVEKRLAALGLSGLAAYLDYLEVRPEEFVELINTVLINVTAFFRDPEAWEYLASDVLPALLEKNGVDGPIRVWSAGCATGDEPYTVAIMLAEALGLEACKLRVKIYATDADESALSQARLATYGEASVRNLDPGLLERYFEATKDGRFVVRSDLRRCVIFGRHDLTQDAPISRVDLLVCRNVLMYFNSEMQSRILARFAVGLADGGVLFLGRAETLLSRNSLFAPLDLRRRLFTKAADPGLRERVLSMSGNGHRTDGTRDAATNARLQDLAFEASPVAQVVVDRAGLLSAASDQARILFGLLPSDIGRPLQDLELSYRPLELRSRIDELHRSRRTVTVTGVTWTTPGGEVRTSDVQFCALLGQSGEGMLGVTINFADTSGYTRLQRQLTQSNQKLEAAFDQLQSTNEELETTNEELQSTVEELETTNEELQSTNEELETMNEELQSTNEELQAINSQVRERSTELELTNVLLDSILASLRGGVVVLDGEFRVVAWNAHSEELWGVRTEEALTRNFFSLDIGLPVDALWQPVRRCLVENSTGEGLELEATNRRGKRIRCNVSCRPLRGEGSPRGVIVVVEPVDAVVRV